MNTYTNPVHASYFADPFVWRTADAYLAIGTGAAEAAGIAPAGHCATVFPLLRSANLVDWHDAGYALVRPDPALGDTYWAPEIAYAEGRWFLYYSVGYADRQHQLRVATSDRPAGPYHDCAQLTDPRQVPFAIDPHPFQDDDGRWYLFHARDFLDAGEGNGEAVRAGTGLVVQPLDSMTELAPQWRVVARARHDWQRFAADRYMPAYAATFDWHTLEGPFVVKHDTHYYCLYSGGCWQTQSYGVDYVVAEHVLGPYVDQGAAAGPRILRTVPGRVIGPGHCSVVRGPQATAQMLAYHAWDPAACASTRSSSRPQDRARQVRPGARRPCPSRHRRGRRHEAHAFEPRSAHRP
jgi:beta-xylosidase